METPSRQVGRTTLRLLTGDITRIPVDAVVNAANAALIGGGGVDGAIHRAGGPAIMNELNRIRPAGGCPTGSAVATGAGALPAKYVFHAVGPVWRGGQNGEPAALASCYATCLRLAEERAARTISFPAISTGIYGYPVAEAAQIAVGAVCRYLEAAPETVLEEILFVLFDEHAFRAYRAALCPPAPVVGT